MKTPFVQKRSTSTYLRYANAAGLFTTTAALLSLSSCQKIHEHLPWNKTAEIVYVETNDFANNNNAVMAYLNFGDNKLETLPGSPFLTNGEGVGNLMQQLGPEDSDTQLKISPDGKFLLAINPGTNTIAVFQINFDGTITPVSGSPFASGGQTPSSIDMQGNHVYVVNKSDDYAHTVNQAPNYTTFTMDADGKLTPVVGSTYQSTPGSSPAQALVSNNGKFLFGADWLGFMLMPPTGTLRSFTISNGMLTPVAGTPQVLPDMNGGALGLWQHPSANVLYVGFPVVNKVGVYAIDNSTGGLTYQTAVNAGVAACWIRTNKSGNRLYVLNSGENSISVYNTSNPWMPVSMGKLTLKKSGPIYMLNGASFTTSEDFSLNFSPSGKTLYVVSQHTNTDFSIGSYNYLHALAVDNDGMLTEDTDPIHLPVPATLRPQGVAVHEIIMHNTGSTKEQ